MKMMNPKLARATKKPLAARRIKNAAPAGRIKARATKKPLAAQRIKNAAPAGRTKGGIGMTGGPKPKPTAQMAGANRALQAAQKLATPQRTQSAMNAGNAGFKRAKADFGMPTPPSTNVNPVRPRGGMTGGARGGVEQNYRGVPGLVNASMDTPNFGGVASNSIGNVGTGGLKRSRADFGMPTPPSTIVNPIRPRGAGAGTPQRQNTQSVMKAAMSGAGATPQRSFGAKKGRKVKGFRDGGIYTADMGQPPQDIDGGSAPLKKPAPKKTQAKKPAPKKPIEVKKAKGGSIDGIAQRGKTRGKVY